MNVICIVVSTIFISCCRGLIIMRKNDIIIKQNYSYVQHSPKTNFNKIIKVKLSVDDNIDLFKKRPRETVHNQAKNSIYEPNLVLSKEEMNENTSVQTENFDIHEFISKYNLKENFLQKNQTGLEADDIVYIDINGLPNSDKNQSPLLLSLPKIIKKFTIGDDLNRTQSNKTLDYPLIPECYTGDGNCTKCREVSPYCHYMYSEKRCVYFGTAHATRFYECGRRWFVVDDHKPFFITLALVLVISSAVCAYMIWLRMKLSYSGDEITPTDYEALRSAVQKIRERRLPESVAVDTHLNPGDTQSVSH